MSKKVLILIFPLLLIIPNLWAGGWNNTLMGCRALALGGFVGVADDPSAIFYNPAGLVFQPARFNLSIDGFTIWPTHEYAMPNGTRIQSKYRSSLPQVFLTYKTNDKLTLGFGFYVPYAGGGVDWKKEDLGVPFKSTLGIYTLTPTMSYQVSDKLSIGFNLNFYGSSLTLNTETEDYGPMSAEESGSGFSAGVGLMFKPTEKIGIGLSVRGPTRMKLTGSTTITASVPGIGEFPLELQSETYFNLPWDIEVGFSYRVTESLLFTTSAQYTMWSALDKVEKTIKNVPLEGDISHEEDMKFNDILILRAGAEYLIPGGIFLRAGVGLDRCACPEETLSISNIDVDKFTLVGGVGYKSGSMQIDFVYISAQGREREKQLTGLLLTEKYNLSASILGIGVTFSF